jgi:hypothetical protein
MDWKIGSRFRVVAEILAHPQRPVSGLHLFILLEPRGAQIFEKSGSHLKIVVATSKAVFGLACIKSRNILCS